MRHYDTEQSVSITAANEQLLPFSQVPEFLRSRGAKAPHVSAVYRWHLAGLSGVRLEALKIGGRFHTSVEALDRFFRAVSEADRDAS
jgi:hypothetical protein